METEPESTENLTRIVVRGAGLASVVQIFTQLLGLVFYIVMARLATPAVFGAFAAAAVMVTFTGIFAESGMQAAVIQRRDDLEAAAATAVLGTFAAGIGLAVLALAIAKPVGLYFHSDQIGLVAAALAGLLFLNAVPLVPAALMQRRFLTLRRMVLEPISIGVYGAVTAAALAGGLGIWGFVVGSYAGAVARAAAAWLLAGWWPKWGKASFGMWRELAGYGRHVVTSEFLREVSAIANTALIGRFLGTAPLGHYKAGARVGTQLTTPIISASVVMLLPAFSRIAADETRLRAAAIRALRLQWVVLLPLGLSFVPLGEQIALVLLGDQWREAGRVLGALCGVTATLPVTQIASEVFKGVGKPSYLARQWTLGGATTVAATVAFLRLGAVGVAGGVSLAAVVVACYAGWSLAKLLRMRVRELLLELVHPAVAAAIMTAILLVLRDLLPQGHTTLPRLGWLALEALIGLAVYLGSLAAIKPALLGELLALGRLQRRSSAAPGTQPTRPLDN